MAHRRWLARQAFEHQAAQIVFQEMSDAIEDAAQRLHRLDEQLAAIVETWSMKPVVEAYQAMRGVSFLVAVAVNAYRLYDAQGIFPPEELQHGMQIMNRHARQSFREENLDLLTVEYWERIQQKLLRGEIPELQMFPDSCKLDAEPAADGAGISR